MPEIVEATPIADAIIADEPKDFDASDPDAWDDIKRFGGLESDRTVSEEWSEDDELPRPRKRQAKRRRPSGKTAKSNSPPATRQSDSEPDDRPRTPSKTRRIVLVSALLGGLAAAAVIVGILSVQFFSDRTEPANVTAERPRAVPESSPEKKVETKVTSTDLREDKAGKGGPNTGENPGPKSPPEVRAAVPVGFSKSLIQPESGAWPGKIFGPFKGMPPRQIHRYSISEDGRRVAVISTTHCVVFGPEQFAGQAEPLLLAGPKIPRPRHSEGPQGPIIGWLRPANEDSDWSIVVGASHWEDERIQTITRDALVDPSQTLLRLNPETFEPAADELPTQVVLPMPISAMAENGTIDRHLVQAIGRFESGMMKGMQPAIEVHWRSGTSRYLPRPVSQIPRARNRPMQPSRIGTLRLEAFPAGGGGELVDGVVDGTIAFGNVATPNARFVGFAPLTTGSTMAGWGTHGAPGRFVGAIPGRGLVVSLVTEKSDNRRPGPPSLVLSDDLSGQPIQTFRLPEAFNGVVGAFDPPRTVHHAGVAVAVSQERIAVIGGQKVAVLELESLDLPDRQAMASDIRVSADRQPGRSLAVSATAKPGVQVEFISFPDGTKTTSQDGSAQATWTPNADDVGDVDFVVRHTSGIDVVDQTVRVPVGPAGLNIDSLGLHGHRVVGLTPDGSRLLTATTGDAITVPGGIHQVALIDLATREIVSRTEVPDIDRVGWMIADQVAIAVELAVTRGPSNPLRSERREVRPQSITTFTLNNLQRVAAKSFVPEGKEISGADLKLKIVQPGALANPKDVEIAKRPLAALLVIAGVPKRQVLKLPSLESLSLADWVDEKLPPPDTALVLPYPGGYKLGPLVLNAAGEFDYLSGAPIPTMFSFGSMEGYRARRSREYIHVPGTDFALAISGRVEKEPGRGDDLLIRAARAGNAQKVSATDYGAPLAIPPAYLSYATFGSKVAPTTSSPEAESLESLLLLGHKTALITDGVHVSKIDCDALAPSDVPMQGSANKLPAGRPRGGTRILFTVKDKVRLDYESVRGGDGKPVVIAKWISGTNLRFDAFDPPIGVQPTKAPNAKPQPITVDLTSFKKFQPFRHRARDAEFPGIKNNGESFQQYIKRGLKAYLERVRDPLEELLGKKIKGVPIAITLNIYVTPEGTRLASSDNAKAIVEPLNHTIIIAVPEKTILDAFKERRR